MTSREEAERMWIETSKRLKEKHLELTLKLYPLFARISLASKQFLDNKNVEFIQSEDLSGIGSIDSSPKNVLICDNEIWVGYGYPGQLRGKGISRFSEDGIFLEHYLGDQIGNCTINRISLIGGEIWAATSVGPFRYSESANKWMQPLSFPDTQSEVVNIIQRKSNIYIGSQSGLIVINTKSEVFHIDNMTPNDYLFTKIVDFCVLKHGQIWTIFDLARPNRLKVINGKNIESINQLPQYPQRIINVNDEFIITGGWGELSIHTAYSQEMVSYIKVEKRGLSRAICSLYTDHLYIIFWASGNQLYCTYVIHDFDNLVVEDSDIHKETEIGALEIESKLPPQKYNNWLIELNKNIGMIYDLTISSDNKLFIISDEIQYIDLNPFLEVIL